MASRDSTAPLSPESLKGARAVAERFHAWLRDNPDLVSEQARLAYEAGDTNQLFQMIDYCAAFDWKLPQWIRVEFRRRWQEITRARVGSLDEAFGRPFPKGAHIGREHENVPFTLWYRIRELHREGSPLDDALFERAGKEFAYGTTKCRDLYYSFDGLAKKLESGGFELFPQKTKN